MGYDWCGLVPVQGQTLPHSRRLLFKKCGNLLSVQECEHHPDHPTVKKEIQHTRNPGPQFDSHEFAAFSNDWQFPHITSSLTYP